MMITFSVFASFILRSVAYPYDILLSEVLAGIEAEAKRANRGGSFTRGDRRAVLPAVHRRTQLEEGDHPEGDGEPECDQAVDQHRRKDGRLRQAEQDESADHPRIH